MLITPAEFAVKVRRTKTQAEVFAQFTETVSRLEGVEIEISQLPKTLPSFADVRLLSTAEGRRLTSPFAIVSGPKDRLRERERWWLSVISDWTLDVLASFEARTRHGSTCLRLDSETQAVIEGVLRKTSVVGLLAIRFESVESSLLELLDVVRLRLPGSRALSAGSGVDGLTLVTPNLSRDLLIQGVGTLREELEDRFITLGLRSARVSMGLSHLPGDSKGVPSLIAGAQIGARRAAELPGNCIHAVVAPGEEGGDVGGQAAQPPGAPKPPSPGLARPS